MFNRKPHLELWSYYLIPSSLYTQYLWHSLKILSSGKRHSSQATTLQRWVIIYSVLHWEVWKLIGSMYFMCFSVSYFQFVVRSLGICNRAGKLGQVEDLSWFHSIVLKFEKGEAKGRGLEVLEQYRRSNEARTKAVKMETRISNFMFFFCFEMIIT